MTKHELTEAAPDDDSTTTERAKFTSLDDGSGVPIHPDDKATLTGYKHGQLDGTDAERTAIVAWLRLQAVRNSTLTDIIRILADAIERGEHTRPNANVE